VSLAALRCCPQAPLDAGLTAPLLVWCAAHASAVQAVAACISRTSTGGRGLLCVVEVAFVFTVCGIAWCVRSLMRVGSGVLCTAGFHRVQQAAQLYSVAFACIWPHCFLFPCGVVCPLFGGCCASISPECSTRSCHSAYCTRQLGVCVAHRVSLLVSVAKMTHFISTGFCIAHLIQRHTRHYVWPHMYPTCNSQGQAVASWQVSCCSCRLQWVAACSKRGMADNFGSCSLGVMDTGVS
jgi:hypothetical protein